ncbi:hypothetical protein BGZ47_000825 [Haplosporangium gracile]|nr:hypothetical protein BGZ47_000825 [Haplosporangium gracile]
MISAQLDTLVANMASVTSSLAQDTLHLRGEINFDDSQELRSQLSQWSPSLREQNASHIDNGSDTYKEDGFRFKDHPIETIVRSMGRERKRSANMAYDGASSDRKRRKNQPDWGLKQSSSSVTTTSTETAAHLLRFLERRLDQRYPNSTSCSASKQPSKSLFKQKTSLDFDPLHLLHTWSSPSPQDVAVGHSTTPSSPTSSSASSSSRRRRLVGHKQPYHNSLDCRQQHASPEKCQCRKRGFAEAIELSRPLTMNADIASHHPNWIESIKKRKVHQNATKWTSALSPAPYVRLLTLRNFWEMMEPRQDLSWRSVDDTRFRQDESEEEEGEVEDVEDNKAEMESMQMETDSTVKSVGQKSARRKSQQPSCIKTVKQYPCPGHFLRGLWEEELRNQRVRQMIPDTVRKPIRGKIYHAKPIATLIKQNKPSLLSLLTESLSSASNSAAAAGGLDDSTTESKDETCEATPAATSSLSTTTSTSELELSLKKKHRAAAIIRSHAITEGSDMSEYKPWKDGTVTPRQGSLQALKASRSNIMDPWPVEEAKSKDECMRVLHRMREQLNIVINLQIHLRSMMKTAPTQWSFLLSIRHPGQVSIELLLALYGPHFMQTSNFRAIEELLWGTRGHSQQATPSIDIAAAVSSSNPALVQT